MMIINPIPQGKVEIICQKSFHAKVFQSRTWQLHAHHSSLNCSTQHNLEQKMSSIQPAPELYLTQIYAGFDRCRPHFCLLKKLQYVLGKTSTIIRDLFFRISTVLSAILPQTFVLYFWMTDLVTLITGSVNWPFLWLQKAFVIIL